jgi:hypothetical protein
MLARDPEARQKLFVAAVGSAILEPDPHNLIVGGLRTIRPHCFHLNPTSGTKIHHRINMICASSHQRPHLGVEPSFEVNNAGGGYLIIAWFWFLLKENSVSSVSYKTNIFARSQIIVDIVPMLRLLCR